MTYTTYANNIIEYKLATGNNTMQVNKNVYLVFAVIGTVVPWLFFTSFIAEEGLNIPLFIESLFVNGAAGGFSADVLISIAVFWVWSYADAQNRNVGRWWVMIPAGFRVGLSLALPLYLYFRAEAEDISD